MERIERLNEATISEISKLFEDMDGLRVKLAGLSIRTLPEMEISMKIIRQMAETQEKLVPLMRLAHGINDKAPAVQVDNRFVMLMPPGVASEKEWMEKYGIGRIEAPEQGGGGGRGEISLESGGGAVGGVKAS